MTQSHALLFLAMVLALAWASSSVGMSPVLAVEPQPTVRSVLVEALRWLNVNSGAVTAAAATAGACLTAVYVFFTIGLWRATKTQAEITRQIFEASHRPYVSVTVEEPTDMRGRDRLVFNMVFENHGTVPAHITAWDVRGTLIDRDGQEQLSSALQVIRSPVGASIAPTKQTIIEPLFIHDRLANSGLTFELHGKVEYQGVAPLTYCTHFRATRIGDSWKMQGSRME